MNFGYGDFLMLKDGKTVFISNVDSKDGRKVSLETAKQLYSKGEIVAIQVEKEGEEFFEYL